MWCRSRAFSSPDLNGQYADSAETTNAALDMLRALDVERITPIEALTTLAKLKDLAADGKK